MEWLHTNLDQIMTGLIAFFSVGGFGAMGLSLLKQVKSIRDDVVDNAEIKLLKEQTRALATQVSNTDVKVREVVNKIAQITDTYRKALDAQLVAQKKEIEARYNAQLDRLRMQISDLNVKLREAQHEQNKKNDQDQ